jgi:Ca2+-binding RTX toxin-like protein
MDLNLVGATFTKLTVTLDGSTAITVANAADASNGVTGGVDPGLTINFDGNAEALAVYNSTTAVTITELVLNAGSSTGTNTLDVSAAAKANVTGGTGADAITGTSGADTISGGSGADNITGGTGADYMTGGAGADTFVFAVAASVASTANTLGTTIAAGNTVTFGSSVDYISDFGSTDILDITTAATVPTSLLGLTTATALTAGTSYVAYGTWDSTTGVFTIAAAFNASTAKDAMVIVDGNSQTAITSTGVVILDDLTAALLAGNIG